MTEPMTEVAATPGSVHVRAPGKLNLVLRVGRAGDDGYHPLATVFQAVSLYEDLVATPAKEISVSVSGRHAAHVPTDESNLAFRAAALLAEATGTEEGVHLEIAKQVPTAGGMGGGSADAAAALLACDLLWETGLAREELGHLAAELGADVPFALTGQTALGRGRGDVLTPALARGRFYWVLALFDDGLATPEVFAAWDRQMAGSEGGVDDSVLEVGDDVMQALVSGDPNQLAEVLENDLGAAARELRPAVGMVLDQAEGAGALAAVVSGSGPTVAALAADHASALEVAAALRARELADEVIVVTSPAHGARLVEPVRDSM
ncbi:4-(cytidine 5'-diphospho)-2-C-methyl-D-erythritol kinase [Ruania halotolerans]|uniref:4-(cytidine 5'-diphospho)-2-C-methyl-D-erythritol kinase n=1 Tax=Ruania halotolerans TaxID=2897773 RepID=UPI001E569C23|nr:4-(cytidine 5'-diphospho)-2-C-methyl-D-erythritol kinase [Ruania halotolerans]UFU07399.1 4-(cytidine 5'-diphospho)-2-C-methyl-D-erythritol kinase [Ruania halotolerans]